MKTIITHSEGFQNLELERIEKPNFESNQVVIHTKAVSVNPVDWKILIGDRFPKPIIPGTDVAGVIKETNSNSQFQVGDRVFGYKSVNPVGTMSEYVAIDEDALALIPENVDFETAAALPVVALTAWQVLFDTCNLQEGEKVLIHAAAGGVGHMAVQFAKWKGAYIYGTASKSNHDFIKDLGVDVAIDYKSQDFTEVAKDIDIVVASVAGDTLTNSTKVLSKNGRIGVIAGHDQIESIKSQGIDIRGMRANPSGKQLDEIIHLISAGKTRVQIDEVFDFEDYMKAFEKSNSGHTQGKLIIKF